MRFKTSSPCPLERWYFARGLVALCCSLLFLPSLASAQSDEESLPPDHTQFLIVVDDSGSMKRTDPDRLAILSARSFIQLLSERDRIAVVGMNELAAGRSEPVRALTRDDAGRWAEANLAPNSSPGLAAYRGQHTPCRSSLESASAILNGWHERDPLARQVLLFLTDGACDPSNTEDPRASGEWLRGLRSESAESTEFFFFLLRFEGNEYTATLEDYASQSGGQVFTIPAGANRPRGILQSFANVFAGAQGYTTSLVGVGLPRRSFARAEGIRVLALRRGGDTAPLEIVLRPDESSGDVAPPSAAPLIPTRSFRHAQGAEFEYRAWTIRPTGARFSIDSPAGEAVLVPDYRRLRAELTIVGAECPEARDASLSNLEDVDIVTSGTVACINAALVSSEGHLSPVDDLSFTSQFLMKRGPNEDRTAGMPFGPPIDMTRRADGYTHSLPTGEESYLQLRASVRLENHPRPLLSPIHPLRVRTVSWGIEYLGDEGPAEEIGLGSVRAGEDRTFEVRFMGEFPVGMGVSLQPMGDIEDHPCFRLGVEASDELAVQVSPGQSRRLQLLTERCREGGTYEGRLRFVPREGTSLQPRDVPVHLVFIETPWWDYWGRLVIMFLLILFGLITLYCLINGWVKPAKELSNKKLAFYYSRSFKALKKNQADFKYPDEGTGTGMSKLEEHLNGTWGWYRSASIDFDTTTLPRPGVGGLSVELRPRDRFWLVHETGEVEIHQISNPRAPQKMAFSDVVELDELGRGTLSRRVGVVCWLYARLFGRMPRVFAQKLETGDWYHLGPIPDGYFFKIEEFPFEE